jgi:hypothetical protein
MKTYWGSGGIAPRTDLSTRLRRVVSFTPRSLYSQGKSPRYPLDRRLDGPQSLSGRSGEEKNSQPLTGFEPPIIQSVAQRYTIELSPAPNAADVPVLTKHHATNTYGGAVVKLHAILTLALGGECSASRPGCFTPGERAAGTHSIGGWVGSRASLDAMQETNIPAPSGNLIPVVRPAP